MKWQWWILSSLALVFGTSVFGDLGTTNAFDRYKIIIEKSPFRRFAEPASAAAKPAVESLVLTGIMLDSDQKKVCLRDNKSNKSYYVGEGETVLDFRIDKIDPDNQSVVLVRGVETYPLKFPERTAAQQLAPPPVAPRPVYRVPLRPAPPAPAAAPPAVPTVALPNPAAATVAAGAGEGEQPPAPQTSLRRRILRQQLKLVQPEEKAATPGAAKDAEGQAEQTPETTPQ